MCHNKAEINSFKSYKEYEPFLEYIWFCTIQVKQCKNAFKIAWIHLLLALFCLFIRDISPFICVKIPVKYVISPFKCLVLPFTRVISPFICNIPPFKCVITPSKGVFASILLYLAYHLRYFAFHSQCHAF